MIFLTVMNMIWLLVFRSRSNLGEAHSHSRHNWEKNEHSPEFMLSLMFLFSLSIQCTFIYKCVYLLN